MIAGEHRLALPAGYQLGKYLFKDVLGAGGFGITYLAEDHSLGRRVAIKELLPNDIATRLDGSTVVAKSKSEEDNLAWARDRFMKEGKALAACEHPSVVHVYEMIEANGTAYMVTKYEDGRSLSAWLKEVDGSPTEKELRSILIPLLAGLEKVHKAGFLHRDLKPENIYITDDGRPLLLDFGSARQAVSDRTTSLTSIVTSGYAPFEQYHEDGKQGAWTDLYALAAVLYRAIHGKKPPEATRRLKDDPCLKLAREYSGKYSPQFLHAIDKALAVEGSKRPQSVAEWRTLLGDGPIEQEVIAIPQWRQWLKQGETWVRANPKIAAGAVVGVVILTFLATREPKPTPGPVVVVDNSTPVPAPPQPGPDNNTTPTPPVSVPTPAPVKPTPPPSPVGGDPEKKGMVWDNFKNSTPRPTGGLEPEAPRKGPKVGEKWTNSQGQVLAWIPGIPVHMTVTETRRGDFEAFVRATGYDATQGVLSWTKTGWKSTGATWANPGFAQTPMHPVVGVSAYDALEYCRWLTDKDRAAGLIDDRMAYRLPTDAEWGKALQDWKFPWGDTWPPTVGAGNYAGEEAKTALGANRYIAGYRDGFINTSPAGTFQGNAAGFYDLGGNAIEICGSWFQVNGAPPPGEAGPVVVLRGGSWLSANPDLLLLSARDFMRPEQRFITVGFRVVIAPVTPQPGFVLPPLQNPGADWTTDVVPGDGGQVEKRLVGIWESKFVAPTGTTTLRWEQEPDGSYTLSGLAPDSGRMTAAGGRMMQSSDTSGLKTSLSYRFKTTTQLVTSGPLGEATWRKVSSTTTKMKDTARVADADEDKNRDEPQSSSSSQGSQSSPGTKRTEDAPSRPKPRVEKDVERKFKDIGNSIRRRLPF